MRSTVTSCWANNVCQFDLSLNMKSRINEKSFQMVKFYAHYPTTLLVSTGGLLLIIVRQAKRKGVYLTL